MKSLSLSAAGAMLRWVVFVLITGSNDRKVGRPPSPGRVAPRGGGCGQRRPRSGYLVLAPPGDGEESYTE